MCVTEAWQPNQQDDDYGIKPSYRLPITAAPRQAGELLAHIEADLKAFSRRRPHNRDDVTYLVITKE